MKNKLRLTAVLACTLIIAMATSVIGAAISNGRNEQVSAQMNTKRGVLTDEELQAFFNDNQALLESIATQLIPLYEEFDLYMIEKRPSQIVAADGDWNHIALDAKLYQQLEQYFSAAGTANTPKIIVQDVNYSNLAIIKFSFNLSSGKDKGILYSTDPEVHEEWEAYGDIRLGDNFIVFQTTMGAPPKRVPAWLQWILRWMLFGWVWM